MAATLVWSAATTVTGNDPGRDFRQHCAELAGTGDDMAIPGDGGWLFLRSELRHVGIGKFWGEAAAAVSRASSPDRADPLPVIVDFSRQLKQLGIELIVAPVPGKAFVYPEKLSGQEGRFDVFHQEFYRILRQEGVSVLDFTPYFMDAKLAGDQPDLYCRTDSHWSPHACEIAARLIAGKIGSPPWLEPDPNAFAKTRKKRTIVGDLTGGEGSEELPLRLIAASEGLSTSDRGSPVVLLGDSHCLVFHAGGDLHGTGAGLADQLAFELGLPIDVVGVRGSGATAARVNFIRRVRAQADYLPGKKVVVWVFAARDFSESAGAGWAVLPLLP